MVFLFQVSTGFSLLPHNEHRHGNSGEHGFERVPRQSAFFGKVQNPIPNDQIGKIGPLAGSTELAELGS
jgi:phage FluMu protein gp41